MHAVLIQIARRGRYQKKATKGSKHPPTLPDFSNIVLLTCLTMLLAFSVAGYLGIQESEGALRIFAVLFLSLNIATVVSMISWKWKKKSGKMELDWRKGLNKDHYRLYSIFYDLGLFIALLGKSPKGIAFWTALSGALILLNTHGNIRKRLEKITPMTYATLTTLHMTTGTYIILGSAIYFVPELSFLMITMAVVLGVLLVLMWLETLRRRSLDIP